MQNACMFGNRITLKDGTYEIESTVRISGQNVFLNKKRLQVMQNI